MTAERAALTADMRRQRVEAMLQHLGAMPLQPVQLGMSFRSLESRQEIPTRPFEQLLEQKQLVQQWCYPRLQPGSSVMEAVIVHEATEWRCNHWGIEEPFESPVADPAAIQLVLVPLLAIDKSGQRVGYGKGYYDRFLSLCKPEVITIGLSWFEPVEAIADISGNDVPLKYCLTPQKLYVF